MSNYGQCCIQLADKDLAFFDDKITWQAIDLWLAQLGFPPDELEDLETHGRYQLTDSVIAIEHEESDWYDIGHWLIGNYVCPIAVSQYDEYGSVRLLATDGKGNKCVLHFEQEDELMESPDYQKDIVSRYFEWRKLLPAEFIEADILVPIDDIISCFEQ